MIKAEQWVIDHNLGDVISQSFGATENTFPGFSEPNYGSLRDLRYAFADAARQQVTVLASSGDSGATNDEADGATLYPYRAVSWPSSDPLVTSVGGTQLLLAQDGNRIQPDQVWNDTYGASGGGVSSIFARPSYQDGVTAVVGDKRGIPDISMSAAVTGGCWVYESFEPAEPLGDPRRHQRGDTDLRRDRGPGRPGGRPSPRQHQPGALRARRAQPGKQQRRVPHRDH